MMTEAAVISLLSGGEEEKEEKDEQPHKKRKSENDLMEPEEHCENPSDTNKRVALISVNEERTIKPISNPENKETINTEQEETSNETLKRTPSEESVGHIVLELEEDGSVASKSSEDHTQENQTTSRPFDDFLEACASSLKGSQYETKVLPKFPRIRKYFDSCKSIQDEPFFKGMLNDSTATARKSAADAVIVFQRMYSYFLDNIAGAGVEVPEEYIAKLKKLDKHQRKLIKKIKQLEEEEVDFEKEQNSSYLQLHVYTAHLVKVNNKFCQLLKKNPHSGRLTYQKIQFVNSRHDAINRAITKAYKLNQFPTYYDIEKCVRKCVTEHNLGLSEGQIKEESKHCFTKLGNLLQIRRKRELYETHLAYIENKEDPASKNQDLKEQLDESYKEGEKRIAEVVNSFVNIQEDNNAPIIESSEDSDDSNFKDSDSDDAD